MKPDCDVLVVGAGPSGAIAAMVLARAGVSVRVLDRARFPRFKLCGDSVNPGAMAILDRLSLRGAVAGALPVDGMIVTGRMARAARGRTALVSRDASSRGIVSIMRWSTRRVRPAPAWKKASWCASRCLVTGACTESRF